FLNKKIEVIKINKKDYSMIINPVDYESDWKSLIEQEETRRDEPKKKINPVRKLGQGIKLCPR
ncbi:MAG: hypothetical protein ABIK26_06380, partial [Candidatus Omnitrophota bacterium]